MKMKCVMLLLSAMSVLTGCVDYRWVKSGASEHDRQMQLTACQARALKDLPPDNVVENTYSTSSTKDKPDDKKIVQDKETYHRIRDANGSEREVLVDNCMLQKGWDKEAVNQ